MQARPGVSGGFSHCANELLSFLPLCQLKQAPEALVWPMYATGHIGPSVSSDHTSKLAKVH